MNLYTWYWGREETMYVVAENIEQARALGRAKAKQDAYCDAYLAGILAEIDGEPVDVSAVPTAWLVTDGL